MRLYAQAYEIYHRSQRCGVKPIHTHCKTVAVMVSYDSILHICEFCGDEVCREFFDEPNSSPHEVSGIELNVWTLLNEATMDSVQ